MKMRKFILFISFLLSALSFNTNANSLIFKCKFNNNKQVSLFKEGNDVIYSFEKPDSNPDLKITRKRSQIDTNFGNLSGRYATNTIEIKNGAYSYRLTTSIDRIAKEQEPMTSLTVIKDKNYITSLQCLKGSEKGELISIDD